MKLPNKTYDVLLLDPPWSYHGQQDKWGAAAKFYDTMTDQDLQNMNITSLLNKKAVVFMWATAPRLDFAIDLLRDWGLTYRGCKHEDMMHTVFVGKCIVKECDCLGMDEIKGGNK